MSFDRSDHDVGEHAHEHHRVAQPADQLPDSLHAGRAVEVGRTADTAKDAPRLPTREERIEAHQKARESAAVVYAAWYRRAEGEAGPEVNSGASPHADTTALASEAASRERADHRRTTPHPDKPSATEEALRKRVDELEADKVARDRQLAAQDAKLAAQAKTLADQDVRIERLEAYVGQITTAVRDLRQAQDETQPSTEIAGRARGGEAERAEWQEPQHKRRLPTDAWNNVISVAAGGVVTDLAYHLHELSPEVAGIGAAGATLGAGIIAVWREHREAKDDADHRPKG